MKIGQAIINHEAIEPKLVEYFDDEAKFDKVFTIYLKVHTAKQHFKSSNKGKLISKETYNKVIKSNQIVVIKSPKEGRSPQARSEQPLLASPRQGSSQHHYYISFSLREVKVDNMVGFA